MRSHLLILVLGGWMIAGSPALASTTIPMSFDQLTQASSVIAQARVLGQSSEWNPAHTMIVTVTTVAVSRAYKGVPAGTLEIEQPGGTVGNRRMFVPGDITFQAKQTYILFLEPLPASPRYRVVGMTQGTFPVYQDAVTHQDRVFLPLSRLSEMQNQAAENPAGTYPVTGFQNYVVHIVDAGIHIPRGLSLPVSILSAPSRGTGRAHVYAKTLSDLFPNRNLVIPAGSEIEGEAVLNHTTWTINWDELNVRGVHTQISAVNRESDGKLPGRNLVLLVR